jgi:hypothetical protein
MKNLFENWKKFINEGPYDEGGSGTYDVETGIPKGKWNPESMGRKDYSTQKFNADFTTIMNKTPDNWVFIFLKDIYVVKPSPFRTKFTPPEQAKEADAFTEEHKKEFNKWLKTKLNDSKYNNSIVVVVTGRVSDDPTFGTTANWFLHDIIGHVITLKLDPISRDDYKIIRFIHKNLLTVETAPVTTKTDLVPDIVAAIITGHLTKDKVEELIKNSKLPKGRAMNIVNELFTTTQSWLDSLKRWPDGYNRLDPYEQEGGGTTFEIF